MVEAQRMMPLRIFPLLVTDFRFVGRGRFILPPPSVRSFFSPFHAELEKRAVTALAIFFLRTSALGVRARLRALLPPPLLSSSEGVSPSSHPRAMERLSSCGSLRVFLELKPKEKSSFFFLRPAHQFSVSFPPRARFSTFSLQLDSE